LDDDADKVEYVLRGNEVNTKEERTKRMLFVHFFHAIERRIG
jgi:hypothetical protein